MNLTLADAYHALTVIHSNGLNAIVALHGPQRDIVVEHFLNSVEEDEVVVLKENQPDFSKRVIEAVFDGLGKTVVVSVDEDYKPFAQHQHRISILNHMIHLKIA